MKIRILAMLLALIFVVSAALVSCEAIDEALGGLDDGLSGEDGGEDGGDNKITGNNKHPENEDSSENIDLDSSDDRDTEDDDAQKNTAYYPDYSETEKDSVYYPDYSETEKDSVYYPDYTETWESDSEEDTFDNPNYSETTDKPVHSESFDYPEYSDETTKPTSRPGFETNDYGEETFTSPNDYIEIGRDDGVQGETLNIIVREQASVMREWYRDVYEDEVDEVVAYRNERVVDMIKLESVSYTLMGSSNYEDCLNTFTKAIIEDVDNDFHYYDIVANYAYAGAITMVRNYIANLADYETFPYFDFSLPCWNQSIVNSTLCNDKLYYITGDLNLSTFDKSMVVFVNNDLYTERKDDSDPDNLQDVALAGKWDYEDLYKWTSVYEDFSDDNAITHDDFYGISTSYGSIPLDALPYAWDLEYIVEEADGSHSYNVIGNTKIAEAVNKAKALFRGVDFFDQTGAQGVGNWNNTGSCTLGGYSEPVTHFANDLSVFLVHLLNCTIDDKVMMREMSSEMGLLPMPKYDEDQENYGTTSHDAYTLVTVIDHSDNSVTTKGEAISAYLQLSYEESYTNIRGYYINEIVKQKYFGMSDSLEKSQKIFDIVADNIEFDFASVYAPQLNGFLNSCWRYVVTESNGLGATTAEEAFLLDEVSYEASLEEVDSWLGLI